ncbi:oxygenase MpaB family protein, partial [Actinomadura kijaniata]|uniref:oxygenase MpaB family protein n=1 Tax=Actinomadura kijaniata TaxID=46161 RepID=UPI00082AED4F
MAASGAARQLPEPTAPDTVVPERSGTAGRLPDIARDTLTPFALAAAGANVIMQLSRLPVGHGVIKSPVESGRIDRHPIKRLRTTLSYIVVAMHGTPDERDHMRGEVNRSHRAVRSLPGDPVKYNAFDRELQLWVAACLYWGTEDLYIRLYGEPTPEQRDDFYRHAARFGTTLQVTEDMWPADREAFEKYWADGVEKIVVDDLTRRYLRAFAGLYFLPGPMRRVLGPTNRFLCVGFLPEPFREALGFRWSAADQRRFDRFCRAAAAVNRNLPGPVRGFPWNLYLWDVRRRIRDGRPIV